MAVFASSVRDRVGTVAFWILVIAGGVIVIASIGTVCQKWGGQIAAVTLSLAVITAIIGYVATGTASQPFTTITAVLVGVGIFAYIGQGF